MRILLAMAFVVPLGCTSSTAPSHDLSGAWADLELVFTYDQSRGGLRQVFNGHIELGMAGLVVMVGTVTDSAGGSFSATYRKR